MPRLLRFPRLGRRPGRGAAGRVGAAILAARGLLAPILAITVTGLTLSMSFPLFALLLERAGASGTMIGLNSMAAPVAIVLGAPLMPLLLRQTGLAPLVMGAVALMGTVFALLPLGEGMLWWTALRFVHGFAVTALFFAGEFWIVSAAPPTARGRVIAVYSMALSGSFLLGPLILLVTGDAGTLPFYIGAAIVVSALVPLAWGAGAAPEPEPEAPPRLGDTLRFFRTDPALLWAIVLFGALEYGTLSLLSVWALRAGFETEIAVGLLALFAAGSLALQLPLGWAADRWEPRRLLALAAAVCLAAPLFLVAAAPGSGSVGLGALAVIGIAGLLWGGFGAGLYTISLAGLGGRYAGQRLAKAYAAVTLGYGIGALFAPLGYGLAMDRVAPPHGLLLVTSATAGVYLALVLLRMASARRESA
ncbi:MAG: MFS transporter [Pseudomonadota bacterium]